MMLKIIEKYWLPFSLVLLVGVFILLLTAPASAQTLSWVVIVVVSVVAVGVILSRRLGAYRKGGVSRAALAGGIAWDLVRTAAVALGAVFIASKAAPAAAPVAARLAETQQPGSGAIAGIAAGILVGVVAGFAVAFIVQAVFSAVAGIVRNARIRRMAAEGGKPQTPDQAAG